MSKAKNLVLWGKQIELTDETISKITNILSISDEDERLDKVIQAFKDAASYQRHADNRIKHTEISVKQFKTQLKSIENNLARIKESIKKLSYDQETRLDDYFCFANDNDMTYHKQKHSQENPRIFDSGFMLNISKMEKGLLKYQSELGQGRTKDHRYSSSIRIIGKVFEEEFPNLTVPHGRNTGEHSVFFKLIKLWLKDILNHHQDPKRKIEAAYVDI